MTARRRLGAAERRVGANVRALRIRDNYTHPSLAKAMRDRGHEQWDTYTVNNVQGGRRHLSVEELASLAAIFGVTTDSILTGIVNPELPPTVPGFQPGHHERQRAAFRRTGTPSATVGDRIERVSPFIAAPGQTARVKDLADTHDANLGHMHRVLLHLGLAAAEAGPELTERLLGEIR